MCRTLTPCPVGPGPTVGLLIPMDKQKHKLTNSVLWSPNQPPLCTPIHETVSFLFPFEPPPF